MSDAPPSSSEPIPKDTPKRLRNFLMWAHASRHLLTAMAALIAAMAAFFRPQDHTVTKNSYEATTAGIAKLEEEIKKNHEDIVTLRGYIDGALRQPASESMAEPTPAALAPAIASHKPRRRLGGASLPPPPPPPAGASMDQTSAPALAEALPPLPPIHDQPAPWKAPAFDAIMKK
jgi:hypothetical protein